MSPMSATQRVQFGPFELNLQSGELLRNGRKVRLQGQSFQILSMLLERPREVVTREELQRALWPGDTFVDFESGLNNAVKRLRETLGDTAEKPRFIETLPRRGYRFVWDVLPVGSSPPDPPALPAGDSRLPAASSSPPLAPHTPALHAGRAHPYLRRHVALWIAALALLALAAAGLLRSRSRKVQALTAKDGIVLGEFTNRTSDPVFDETLRRGLAVELEQSPLLTVVSEERIQQVLKRMRLPADTHLTLATAREVCERNAGTAVFDGSITALGSQYVLWVRATNCKTGEVIAEEQARAARREDVLAALDQVARGLRTRIGESIRSLENDKPLAEVTTSSLEALKAYSLGIKIFYAGDPSLAIPLFKHAVELDPDFAAAWGYMACSCSVQPDIARANITRAYELRERTTERERLFIEGTYYFIGTGEFEKAIVAYEAWARIYPLDSEPDKSLALIYLWTGKSETALEWARKALPLEDDPMNYHFMAYADINLNRLKDARATFKQMEQRQLFTYHAVKEQYLISFLMDDKAGMDAWAAFAVGKTHAEDEALATQADTAAWFGDIKKARALTQGASDAARRSDALETAARYQAYGALFEAEVGNRTQARSQIAAALKLSPNRDVRQIAPLVMAQTGDLSAARTLTSELEKEDAPGTWTQNYFLPAIKASIALQKHDPQRAVELLQSADTIELAFPQMLTAYVRGQAFLQLGKGDRAAAEYQKFLDHWGLVRNSPEGALARLGLARAFALEGDAPKAREAYSAFLTLWKDADPTIPLLQQAKRESLALNYGNAR